MHFPGCRELFSGHTEAEGRWFVADPSMLDWYREDAAGPTRTVYVDVPTVDLDQYRVSNSQERIGRRSVASYSKDPENEFFLPREIAATRQELSAGSDYDRRLAEAAAYGLSQQRSDGRSR